MKNIKNINMILATISMAISSLAILISSMNMSRDNQIYQMRMRAEERKTIAEEVEKNKLKSV